MALFILSAKVFVICDNFECCLKQCFTVQRNPVIVLLWFSRMWEVHDFYWFLGYVYENVLLIIDTVKPRTLEKSNELLN